MNTFAAASRFNGGKAPRMTATYNTIINAVAVKTKYGNMQALEDIAQVSTVIMSETYNLPQVATGGTDVSAIENAVDIYETGIFKPVGVDYTGNNTSVAVLDSGFDCEHTVFQNKPAGELLITQQFVSSVLANTTALKLDQTLELIFYTQEQ